MRVKGERAGRVRRRTSIGGYPGILSMGAQLGISECCALFIGSLLQICVYLSIPTWNAVET